MNIGVDVMELIVYLGAGVNVQSIVLTLQFCYWL